MTVPPVGLVDLPENYFRRIFALNLYATNTKKLC